MPRQQLIERYERAAQSKKFRNREISRLEGLSDAVFGFAITLLIVSLEVPKTSGDLLETMRGFFAFALTFLILFSIWHRQFTYFRRYGLEDNVSIALNGALLFMVLFFVYPLKFISSWMVTRAMGGGKSSLLLGVLVSLSGAGAALEARGGAWRYISYLFLAADTVAVVTLLRMRMSGRRHRRAIESISA